MIGLDRRILELLEGVDIAVRPATIAVNVNGETSTVVARCHLLADHGLIRRGARDRRAMTLSPRGEDLLAGNVHGSALGDLPGE
jgi:hypothetical protein